jgi:carbohydrate-selective porin OprB
MGVTALVAAALPARAGAGEPTNAAPAEVISEYVLEAGYVLQLTPTAKLQPDLQVVWNSVHNPAPGPAIVVQLQLDFAW